jgi:hypothetical protein
MGGKYLSKWGVQRGGVMGGVVGEERKEIHWKRPTLFYLVLLCFITPPSSTCKSRLSLIYREKKDQTKREVRKVL